jgi:hypothetical protein
MRNIVRQLVGGFNLDEETSTNTDKDVMSMCVRNSMLGRKFEFNEFSDDDY